MQEDNNLPHLLSAYADKDDIIKTHYSYMEMRIAGLAYTNAGK